jgi:hypothetical protein
VAIDLRAQVLCNLGPVVRGDLGDDLMNEGGLIRTTGSIEFDGILLPAKGTLVQLAYYRPQQGTITRFPRTVRVLRSSADPYQNRSTVEVGCKLTLLMAKQQPGAVFRAEGVDPGATDSDLISLAVRHPPIKAQDVLLYCLAQVGISLAPGARPLQFRFQRSSFDLSNGYLPVVSELLKSECCFGRLNGQEQLEIHDIDLSLPQTAPALFDRDLVELQQTVGAEDPADRVDVLVAN